MNPLLQRDPPGTRRRPNYALRRAAALGVVVLLVGGIWGIGLLASHAGGPRSAAGPSSSPLLPATPTPAPIPGAPVLNPTAKPGPINTSFPGLTTFRGNATRSWYGEGPLPKHPVVLWKYPTSGGMCMVSADNGITFRGGSQTWCGTGWTGQPNVIVHPDGTIEIREGAYDGHYHFLNGLTGHPLRPDLVTGDLAKGSATSDSQGYPLYYAGSRDNFLRVVAMDRSKPLVLWKLNAMTSVPHPIWNNDWDGAPLQIGDYLLEGGENSWFYVIKLNRSYDANHKVQVDPKVVATIKGWDSKLLRAIHDQDISIESSVAYADGVVYFGNSGGLVQGWDISDLLRGGTSYSRVFRYWTGDDVDASIAIDQQGYLYVARHMEENVPRPSSSARDHRIGALMKLNPHDPNHVLMWSVPIGGFGHNGGILSTPALAGGVVYVMGTPGELDAVDQQTGHLLWKVTLPGPTWMSPVPIGGQLLVGDCNGVLHDYDVSDRTKPPRQLWTVQLSGCIESTPAVWHGMIWVGSRGGQIYGIGDPKGG